RRRVHQHALAVAHRTQRAAKGNRAVHRAPATGHPKCAVRLGDHPVLDFRTPRPGPHVATHEGLHQILAIPILMSATERHKKPRRFTTWQADPGTSHPEGETHENP